MKQEHIYSYDLIALESNAFISNDSSQSTSLESNVADILVFLNNFRINKYILIFSVISDKSMYVIIHITIPRVFFPTIFRIKVVFF